MIKNDFSDEQEPMVLIVPGLNNSGPDHWQTYWERDLPHCRRVGLGQWDEPDVGPQRTAAARRKGH